MSLSLSDEIESLLITVWNYREMTEQVKLTLGDGSIIVGQTLEDAEENLSTRRTKFRQQPAGTQAPAMVTEADRPIGMCWLWEDRSPRWGSAVWPLVFAATMLINPGSAPTAHCRGLVVS